MNFPVTASELVEMLNEHIKEFCDGNVMILDEYSAVYKTFDKSKVSRMPGSRFVITCEMEETNQ